MIHYLFLLTPGNNLLDLALNYIAQVSMNRKVYSSLRVRNTYFVSKIIGLVFSINFLEVFIWFYLRALKDKHIYKYHHDIIFAYTRSPKCQELILSFLF